MATIGFETGSWGDARWRSSQSLDDGEYVEWIVTQLFANMIFGLSWEPNTTSFSEIDIGLSYSDSSNVLWWANGGTTGEAIALAVNDVIRFTRSGTSVVVSRGGSTLRTFTGQTVPQYAWVFAAPLGTPVNIGIGQINGSDPTTGVSQNSTFSGAENDFAIDDSKLFLTPHNWWFSGSDYAQSNNPGAYGIIKANSSDITLLLSTTPNSGLSSGSYPKIGWQVDNAAPQYSQLTSGQTDLALLSGGSSAEHTVFWWFAGCDVTEERWTSPESVLRVTGVRLASDGTLSQVTPLPNRTIVYGDSNSEGAEVLGGGVTVANQAADVAFPQLLRLALNSEVSVVGFAGSGYNGGGLGNSPSVVNGWDKFDSAHSRLTGGLFTIQPDYIVSVHGQNDGTMPATNCTTLVEALRDAAPRAEIAIVSNPKNTWVAELSAAITTLDDSFCKFIDIGRDFLTDAPNEDHLSLRSHFLYGSAIGGKLQELFSSQFDYQWKKDGSNITGQIYRRLKLDDVDSGDDGDYSLVVTNRRTGVAVTVGPEEITVT